MVCLDVAVNGSKLCRAGAGPYGLLHADVLWIRRPPGQWRRGTPKGQLPMGINVGGGTFGPRLSFEHLLWKKRALRLGDEVTLRFVKAKSADRLADRHSWEPPRSRDIRPVLTALRSAYEMLPAVRGNRARALQRDLRISWRSTGSVRRRRGTSSWPTCDASRPASGILGSTATSGKASSTRE